MRSFAAWARKEMLEGARSYRFLVLGIAVAFFAFLDPMMLKLLPLIMKAQVGADLSSLIPASRDFAFESFLGDLFEILSLVVCVVLGGIVARERKDRGFVIPVSKGAVFHGIVAAKVLVWAIFIALVLPVGIFTSYLYAGLLFPGTPADLALPAAAALAFSLYFAYVAALSVFMSSIGKSAAVATLASVGVVYGLPALGSLIKVERYLPSYLAVASGKLAGLVQADFLPSAICATAAIVAFWFGSSAILKRVEL
jgi:ABC-2 type transport system permease protein